MTGLILLLILIGLLILTKPGPESFRVMVHELFRQARNDSLNPLTNMLLGGAVSRAMNASVQREVHDCFLFSVAKWDSGFHWATYIGALNTWWCIDSDVNHREEEEEERQ